MRILMSTSNINMGSGASHSFVMLVKSVNKNVDMTPIVLAVKEGEITKRLRADSIRVYVVNYSVSDWQKPVNGCRILWLIRYWRAIITNRLALRKITEIIRNEEIDAVYMNSLTQCLAARAAVKCRVRLIWHIREFMEKDLSTTFVNEKKSVALIGKADRIVAVSGEVASAWEKRLKHPVEVVYNGIDTDSFFCEREIMRDETVSVVISGRITKEKGHMQLLEALYLLTQRGIRNVYVHICGSTHDEGYLELLQHFVREHHLERKVVFEGYKKNMSLFLKDMDICCVCSAAEAFGRVTVEGMLAGVLLIGSDTGGTPELIRDGITGYLYHYGDPESLCEKLYEAVSEKEKSKKLARQGQKYAMENFDYKKCEEKMMKLFENESFY